MYIRCRPGERLLPRNIDSTLKYGGEGINLWGAYNSNGIEALTAIHRNLAGENMNK